MTNYLDFYQSPFGVIELVANQVGLLQLRFLANDEDINARHLSANAITQQAQNELTEYFNRKRRQFSVPLAATGTPFQQRVWRQLLQIPYAETCSYGQLAHAIGQPTASRAVGAANGKNPIALIVPCHRVNGKNGSLTGYAGGLTLKQQLLQFESPALSLI